MKRFSVVALLLLTSILPAAEPSSTVSAEVVEYVRAKPDYARLYLKVETKRPDADASADDHVAEVKKAVAALEGLKIKGLKVAQTDGQAVRIESDARAAGLGAARNAAPIIQFLNTRTLAVTVVNTDEAELTTAITKVQQEAAKLGLGGEATLRSLSSGLALGERGAAASVAYGRRDGWDELIAPAIEKATKRAMKKAELLATSAGLKPGQVVSVSDDNIPSGTNSLRARANESDDYATYQEGELVLKVRVRVVLTATK